jgi:tRNA-2-methylthio-N6-dimethylallyladenosine synthase
LFEVQELLRSQQLSFNKKTINSTMKILVLKKGKKKNQYIGRSPYNQSVYFSSKKESLIGSILGLNITEAFQNSLTGNIVSDF